MYPVHVLAFNFNQHTCAVVLATINMPTKHYRLVAHAQLRWHSVILSRLNEIDTEHRKGKPLTALIQPLQDHSATKEKTMSPTDRMEIDRLFSNITDPRDKDDRLKYLRNMWDDDENIYYPPPVPLEQLQLQQW